MSRDKLSQISDQEWEDIYARLVFFIDNKIRWRYFRVNPEAADIALCAIEKTLAETRPWNSADYSIMEHLCGVARSEIYNLYASHDNTYTRSIYIDEDDTNNIASSGEKSVEDVCIAKDMIDKFIDYIDHQDPILREYAYLRLVKGENAAAQCAEELRVSVDHIYRMARKLTELANRFGANANRDASASSRTEASILPFTRQGGHLNDA
jgi:hypothetical protein